MKNISLALILSCIFLSCTNEYSKLWKNIDSVYKLQADRVHDVYFADTTNETYPFTFENLKSSIEPLDTSRVKEILERGEAKKLSSSEIKSHLPNARFISPERFALIETQPLDLTIDEERTLTTFDSIEKLRTNELLKSDSLAYIKLSQLNDEISRSENFKSYWKKLEYNDKRLLVVYPLYKYKNNILLTFVNFKSKTNSNLIVRIVSTD